MSRRTIAQILAALGMVPAPAFTQVGPLSFNEGAACRMNEIPLGQPARIDARRTGTAVEVKVAANFGCGTTAGRPRAEAKGGEIHLSADTLLPGHPTPACKCTRHLSYRFALDASGAARIVFLKDGQVEGEGRLEP